MSQYVVIVRDNDEDFRYLGAFRARWRANYLADTLNAELERLDQDPERASFAYVVPIAHVEIDKTSIETIVAWARGEG